jgi:hypothetical protein
MDSQQHNFWLSLKNTLAFFSEELLSRKKTIAIFALATICANLIQFIGPYYTQKLIDIAIPAKDAALIGRYTIYFALSSTVLFYQPGVCALRCQNMRKHTGVPQVMVLDEFSSAPDRRTEEQSWMTYLRSLTNKLSFASPILRM